MQLHAVADIARGARLRRRSRDELRHVRDLALVRPLERVPRLQDLGVRAVLVVGQALAAHLAALVERRPLYVLLQTARVVEVPAVEPVRRHGLLHQWHLGRVGRHHVLAADAAAVARQGEHALAVQEVDHRPEARLRVEVLQQPLLPALRLLRRLLRVRHQRTRDFRAPGGLPGIGLPCILGALPRARARPCHAAVQSCANGPGRLRQVGRLLLGLHRVQRAELRRQVVLQHLHRGRAGRVLLVDGQPHAHPVLPFPNVNLHDALLVPHMRQRAVCGAAQLLYLLDVPEGRRELIGRQEVRDEKVRLPRLLAPRALLGKRCHLAVGRRLQLVRQLRVQVGRLQVDDDGLRGEALRVLELELELLHWVLRGHSDQYSVQDEGHEVRRGHHLLKRLDVSLHCAQVAQPRAELLKASSGELHLLLVLLLLQLRPPLASGERLGPDLRRLSLPCMPLLPALQPRLPAPVSQLVRL
mmetsp:Transcript_31220/g.78220  ORF Transcript_31220/g.78220 Transcript_31220/m.78220 type:complete len:471 (-) Transcript_31220:159-1571(-)